MVVKIVLLFVFLFSCSFSFSQENALKKLKPNFVFFLADDCTNWDIGCYGSTDSKTPVIDRLASEGIKFNRCYQAAPMCSPTRHNIYTGLYPVKTGAYPNHTMVNEGTESITQYLKPMGYRIALSGKTHISPRSIFSFEYLGNDKNPEFDRVERFIQETKVKNQPFVLILCSNEPHGPWDKGDPGMFDPDKIKLPPVYVDTKETREAFCRYLAEINYLDGQVGEALEILEKYELEDNTLFIFASEQGNSFPFAKWTLYEAGVKSALIARFPGIIKPGSESDAIVEYADILPTFIDLAGGESINSLDGKSLVPLFTGEKEKIKEFSFSIQTTRGINNGSDYYGIRAVVDENYRYILNLTPDAQFLNAVNNKDITGGYFKTWLEKAKDDEHARNLVAKYKIRPGEELYNIREDKWCTTNLADNPDLLMIKTKLRNELIKWMEDCGDEGQKTEMEAFQHMPRYVNQSR